MNKNVTKKLTNKEMIEKKLKDKGYIIGCWDESLNKIPQTAIKKIIEEMMQEHTDVFLNIRKKLCIVEISTMDEEKDFALFGAVEYFNKYGNLEDALDNDYITQEQFEYINRMI